MRSPSTSLRHSRSVVTQAFDIQIDRRAIEFRVRKVDGMDLVFADRERPQGMMKFFLFASRILGGVDADEMYRTAG